MLPSYKLFALTVALLFCTCAAAVTRADAQELKTEVVPDSAGPLKSTSNAAKPAAVTEPPKIVTNSSVSLDKDSAASVGHHHYSSEAERAQDDLLITKVKSAIAEDGISNGYPVEVDADHGRVTLSGVVASADDVQATAEDAADVRGVVAVRNLLRPH